MTSINPALPLARDRRPTAPIVDAEVCVPSDDPRRGRDGPEILARCDQETSSGAMKLAAGELGRTAHRCSAGSSGS
jgi:hypothetical protein